MTLACVDCSENCWYMLLSNKLSTVVDLLACHLSVCGISSGMFWSQIIIVPKELNRFSVFCESQLGKVLSRAPSFLKVFN